MRKTFLFFLLMILPLSAAAEMPDSFTVGIDPRGYPPFYYIEGDDVLGLSPEITQAVADRMGVMLIHKHINWNRTLLKIKEGTLDGVYNLFRTPERETYMLFPSEHHYFESSSFFVRKGKEFPYDGDLETLRGKLLISVIGYSYGPKIDKADFLQRLPLKDDHQVVRMIMSGRGDLGIGNKAVAYHWAKETGRQDDLVFLSPMAIQQPTYVAFTKKRELDAFVRAFSNELKKFKTTQTYKDILAKYGLE